MNPRLSNAALASLRGSVAALRRHQGGAVPHGVLVDVASVASGECAITIDMEASEVLGAPLVVLHSTPSHREAEWLAELSPRERQIAELVARGLANKEIGALLGITVGTVKDHVHRILEKAGLPNRAAIAAGVR